ncbi:MAG: hypothetical protein WEB30_05080, partial [Cyclobacteriaceae bacterium]
MKRFILFACVYASLSFAVPVSVAGQDLDPYPNYVVIGAFAHHKNAIHFTDDAKQHHFPARFEMNPNRNLYYVYVLTTDDREYAFGEALKLRTETKYFDTWVFSGPLGEGALTTAGSEIQDIDPVTGERIETAGIDRRATIAGEEAEIKQRLGRDTPRQGALAENDATAGLTGPLRDNAIEQKTSGQKDNQKTTRQQTQHVPQGGKNPADNEPLHDSGSTKENENATSPFVNNQQKATIPSDQTKFDGADRAPNEETVERTAPPREFPKKVNETPLTAEEVVGKNFFFQLFRADNREWVEGEVDAIDFERSRKMATYPANSPVKVLIPSGKSKQISFICQVFGYRKQQIEFDPANPSPDFFLDENGNLIVPFELVRLQKGDIAIMYNVFFFKDAAVMRPESRYEVNNLLDLLNENPLYNIRIHGHTNGNASGKIIRLDQTENFYSLSNT